MLGLALVRAQADVCQFLNPNAILRFVLSKAELVGLVIEKTQICLRISEFTSIINFWQKLGHLDSFCLKIRQLVQKL